MSSIFLKKMSFRVVTVLLALIMILPNYGMVRVSALYSESPSQKGRLSANSYTEFGEIPDVVLNDGVYRIRNAGTGAYLSTYKISAKSVGKMFLSTFTPSDDGQCFFIDVTEDGRCRITPQDDGGEYCFCWNLGTVRGCLLTKVRVSEASETSLFDISKLAGGLFTIAPSGGDNPLAVIAAGAQTTEYKHTYASIADYSAGNSMQMWIFEPVPTERITSAYKSTTVKLYSTGVFYVRKYPFNLTTDDIEWVSGNEEIIMVGKGGVWCALGEGKTTVTASVDGASVTFGVEVTPKNAFTWYSQNNIYTSDWDGTILENVYFSSGGVKRRFAVDSKSGTYCSNWIDSGCALCSVAMVLHNLGATLTNGYDLRSGQNGNLPADPYTVALANTGNTGITKENDVMSGNPTYMSWGQVTGRFNLDGEAIAFRRVYGPTRALLKSLLETHPQGVIVELSTPIKSHYVVFTECINPKETDPTRYRFKVYDAAGYFPENGDCIEFEQSTAYTYEGYRYTSMRAVLIFDTVSNINN
ncbi:MAG: hypothetical protein MJ102_01600 [Clostridia bacterium]|nr:hypothetical protein [Clostridia bacterium]